MAPTAAMIVRRRRGELGFTQASLAEDIGVSRETVGRIERGERHPRYLTAWALAQALGVDVEDLLGQARA